VAKNRHSLEIFCGLLFLAAPCIWIYQIYDWLQTGFWHPQPISKWLELLGLGLPSTDWSIIQFIMGSAIHLPVATAFLVLPALIWLAFDALASATRE
jgi:hypothetical protein